VIPVAALHARLVEFAGHRLTLHCEPLPNQHLPPPLRGLTLWVPGDASVRPVVYLRGPDCQRMLDADSGSVKKLGAAFLFAAHEATHVRTRSQDEARVECQASRTVGQLIREWRLPFGRSAEVASAAQYAHEHLSYLYRKDC
jgi:hypothetical protein